MSVPYDKFTKAFLAKISEFDFLNLKDYERNDIVDGYMKRAISSFSKICKYDLGSTGDDMVREFNIDIADGDIVEIVDIVSTGMVAQWMQPYVYAQENLQNVLNTKDFTTYSPSELLFRVQTTYAAVQRDFINMMREYSYNHADLTDLHL